MKTFLLLSVLACGCGVSDVLTLQAAAQSWSYSGNSICYNSGSSSVQCYSSGTIREYGGRDQFYANYEAGRAAGDGIANLISALAAKWAERQARIEAERKDVRSQLLEYSGARCLLLDELQRQEDLLQVAFARLAVYVPEKADYYRQSIEQSRNIKDKLASSKIQTEKNVPIIAGAKNLKFLRESLDVQKKSYLTLYESAKRGYVFTEFMTALVGFFEHESKVRSANVSRTSQLTPLDADGIDKLFSTAEQGLASAQLELGYRYLSGQGVPASATEAARWLRKAADCGESQAQFELGRLYRDGHGVPQDYIAAHMWLNLATAAGFQHAEDARNTLAEKMTGSQVAEGQTLAREWKPQVCNK